MSDTITFEGIELPSEFQGNNFTWQWKEEPEDRVVDDIVELTTYAEALNRKRDVFLEEGIFRSNYFFLKILLRKEWRRVKQAIREQTPLPKEKAEKRKALKARRAAMDIASEPYGLAMDANRRRWKAYQAKYTPEMERLKNELERLYAKEEAERKEAERVRREQAAEKARRKAEKEAAKRAADPHYDAHVRKGEENRRRSKAENERLRRDSIAEIQQMSDEEFADFMEQERQMLRRQGHSKKIVDMYIVQEITAHKKRMAKWRASGLPLGQWK